MAKWGEEEKKSRRKKKKAFRVKRNSINQTSILVRFFRNCSLVKAEYINVLRNKICYLACNQGFGK